MHRFTASALPMTVVVVCILLARLPACSAAGKNLPAAQTTSWKSQLLGKSISREVRLPDSSAEKKPVVVYLKNLPTMRLGELDDATLIDGFLDQGLIVIEVNYEGNPIVIAPELLPEIDRWYDYLFNTEDYPADRDWIYVLPAGYAIDRKVRICEFGHRPVEMDVIYPSGRADPVPLMLQITSTKDAGKWINQRAYYEFLDHHLKARAPGGRVPADQKELDRLANQNSVGWQRTGGAAPARGEDSGARSSTIAALEHIGAVVEVQQTGSQMFAVKVDLRRGDVTDAELKLLSQLSRLRELRLDGILITDDGLAFLQGMTSLQRLDLPNTRIGDRGVGYLKELKQLRMLSIKGNRVTDAGLTHLQGLTQLEHLSLGSNQVSDRGIKSLQDLRGLTYLNLTNTQITDGALAYLKPLSNLRTLRLRDTGVTEEGVKELKQSLPDCSVSR